MLSQITNDCIGHVLRILNACLSAGVRIAGNFYDVPLLSLKLRSDLGEGILRFAVQRGLAGAEANFGVVDQLVLIEVGNGGV